MREEELKPGYIYSGVACKGRRILVRTGGTNASYLAAWFDADLGYLDDDDVTDVRGPLVVLDLDPTETEIVRDLLARSIRPSANKAADQIKEQTRPPLQVGWHEVRESLSPVHWNGTRWTPRPLYAFDKYTPVHYIGPASGDGS